MPIKQQMSSTRDLFTPVSSNESDTNTSSDAAPFRIQSMPLFSEDYFKRQASGENLLANKTPTRSSRLSHYENTTRRMRSVSESDHSEHVSLPLDALSKSNGQIDGRYLPENSKNYWNPNLSSSLESNDECRKYGLTETDLVANSQPRPDFQNQNNGQEVIQIEEDNQETAGPVSIFAEFIKSSSVTERYLVANHQPRPDFENQNNSRDDEQIEKNNQGTAGPVYTPLIMNDDEQIDEYDQGTAGPVYTPLIMNDDEQIDEYDQGTAGPVSTSLIMNDDGQIDEYDQGTAGSLLTSPETPSESIGQENESSGCCSGICMKVCCSLFQRKNILKDTFAAWDIFLSLSFIAIFLFDVITDLRLAEKYHTHIEDNEIYRVYFGLTLGFVIGPSLVLQVCSYPKKQQKEIKKKEKDNAYIPKQVITDLVTFGIHFLQLAVIFRQIRSIFYGLKLRYYECVMNERDREMFDYLWRQELENIQQLRLIETFLEAAPQLVLQIHIVLKTKQIHPITMFACVGSLLSLSVTMTATQRYLRKGLNNKKTQLSFLATIVIFCWRACTITSRVVVFGLFLTVQPIVFVVFIILHWLAATVWIAREKTDFSTWKADAKIYGFVYIFCFIDVHDGKEGEIKHSTFQMFVFYAVVAIENFVLSCWWYFTQIGSHTGLSFGNLSSTSLNETITGLPFGNLSNTSSNEAIVEIELFPTESAAIFQRQHAFIFLMVVHGFFLLGMFFMQVYYQALHSRHFKGSSPNCLFIRPGTITPFSARLGSRTVLEL